MTPVATMTPVQRHFSAALGEHIDQVFALMGEFKHVDQLDPVTREKFRDLRGTLNTFMAGVG